MAKTFLSDIALSEKSYQKLDELYRIRFGEKGRKITNIERFGPDNKPEYDKQLHQDLSIDIDGLTIFGQEKILRNEFIKFNTFTIEFYQNRFTKEEGEFFNLHVQFFTHGYWDHKEEGFAKLYIIKLPKFMKWLKKEYTMDQIKQMTKEDQNSNASFFYFDYDKIPQECIFHREVS